MPLLLAPNQQNRLEKLFSGVNCIRVWGAHADEISELMLQSKAVIGIDSGMTHFAGMLGVKTIAITAALPASMLWGYTDVIPIEPINVACSPCRFGWDGMKLFSGTRCCGKGCDAIKTITGERVVAAVMGEKKPVKKALTDMKPVEVVEL